MENEKVFFWMLGLILLLTIMNTYSIWSISSVLTPAVGITAPEAGALKEAQPLAEAQPPSRQTVSVDDDPSKGPSDAKVTIIEFSDFQCPFCTRFYAQTLPQIEENYIKAGKVRFVYRDFPLGFHPYAQKAAESAECADDQGKYWEYHNILFDKQAEWSNEGVSKFKEYAQTIGLDTGKFNACLDSGKNADEVSKDAKDGEGYGVSGTPVFFVNGVLVSGAQPYGVFQQAIEQELNT